MPWPKSKSSSLCSFPNAIVRTIEGVSDLNVKAKCSRDAKQFNEKTTMKRKKHRGSSFIFLSRHSQELPSENSLEIIHSPTTLSSNFFLIFLSRHLYTRVFLLLFVGAGRALFECLNFSRSKMTSTGIYMYISFWLSWHFYSYLLYMYSLHVLCVCLSIFFCYGICTCM